MRVMILDNDDRFDLKKGDIFSAQRYQYDRDKVTLLKRESDGFDPSCNQYKDSLAYWIDDDWFVLDGIKYIPFNAATYLQRSE